MFNCFAIEVRKGMHVQYHHPRSGNASGVVKSVRKVKFPAALGADATYRVTLTSGATCLADDVTLAWWPDGPYQRTRAGHLRTVVYTLPTHWASSLINGDNSGNDTDDDAAIEAWLTSRPELGPCLSVGDQSWFAPCNDASDLGGDVAQFTFPLLR